jgi:hypothetical protein
LHTGRRTPREAIDESRRQIQRSDPEKPAVHAERRTQIFVERTHAAVRELVEVAARLQQPQRLL